MKDLPASATVLLPLCLSRKLVGGEGVEWLSDLRSDFGLAPQHHLRCQRRAGSERKIRRASRGKSSAPAIPTRVNRRISAGIGKESAER